MDKSGSAGYGAVSVVQSSACGIEYYRVVSEGQ